MTTQHKLQIDPPQTYRADIVVPATEDSPARLVHVQLDARETERLQRIASECAWSVDTLVRTHVSQGLPRHVELLLGIDLRRHEEYTEPSQREQRGEVPRTRQLSPGCEETWAAKLPLADNLPSPMAEDVLHFAPALEPLTLTLSPEATTAVLRYHHVTGDDLNDIVDGVVVGEIEHALKYVADRRQNSWKRTADAISEAASRREEFQSSDPHDGLTGFEHTLVISLSPAAHTLLRAVALDSRQGSVEALVRKLCMTECRRFAEAITDPQQSFLDTLF